MSSPRKWTAVLAEEQGRTAVEDVKSFTRRFKPSDFHSPWIEAGSAGVSVLHSYLARIDPNGGHAESCIDLLNRSVDLASDGAPDPSLFRGYVGLGWAAAYAQRCLELETAELSGIYAAVDDALRELLESEVWEGPYGVLDGLAGVGAYFLMRHTTSETTWGLERTIAILDNLAEERAEGTTWWTSPANIPPDERIPWERGYYDSGLAEGVGGVLGLLNGSLEAGVSSSTCRRLIRGALEWVLSIETPSDRPTRIPKRTQPSKIPVHPVESWACEEVSVSCVLTRSARLLGDCRAEAETLGIGRGAAQDPTPSASSSFYFGTAGVGHSLGRLFFAQGEPLFADAARRVFERILLDWPSSSGLPNRRPGTGFFDGGIGTALAILGASTEVEPSWDGLLLFPQGHK